MTKPKNSALKLRWLGINFVATLALIFSVATASFAQQSKEIEPCKETPSPAPVRVKGGNSTEVKKTSSAQFQIDESLTPDPALEALIAPYSEKVRALANVIGKLEGDLRRERVGAGTMGNFVTDALRAQASRKLGQRVPIMITNAGGLRRPVIAAGDLKAADIFELLPFENALVKLEFTGEQLLRLLSIVTNGRDAQSGARVTYRLDADQRPVFISAKLLGDDGRETEIDPKATYVVVTIDYLLGLKSGDYAILQEGKNPTPLGITMRDAVLEYVKSETASGRAIKSNADNRFVLSSTPQ